MPHGADGRAWVKAARGSQQPKGIGKASLLERERAREVHHIKIPGRSKAQFRVEDIGLSQTPRVVMLQRALNGLLQALRFHATARRRTSPAPIPSATTVPTVSCLLKCSKILRRSAAVAASAFSHASARAFKSPWG